MCVNILCKSKKQYFNNIDVTKLTDNKKFWKTIRQIFLSKHEIANTIILVGNKKNITGQKSHSEHFH